MVFGIRYSCYEDDYLLVCVTFMRSISLFKSKININMAVFYSIDSKIINILFNNIIYLINIQLLITAAEFVLLLNESLLDIYDISLHTHYTVWFQLLTDIWKGNLSYTFLFCVIGFLRLNKTIFDKFTCKYWHMYLRKFIFTKDSDFTHKRR